MINKDDITQETRQLLLEYVERLQVIVNGKECPTQLVNLDLKAKLVDSTKCFIDIIEQSILVNPKHTNVESMVLETVKIAKLGFDTVYLIIPPQCQTQKTVKLTLHKFDEDGKETDRIEHTFKRSG